MSDPLSFRTIRSWDGSQHRAFEELAYQLRRPAASADVEIKTGDPDAGLEWYVTTPDGSQHGWQAKYIFDIDTLLGSMRKSVLAVASKRPSVTKLSFCIPIDLPEDIRLERPRKTAREKFDHAVATWQRDIPGAERIEFDVETAGVLLERLTQPENRGKLWFWWQREALDLDWCKTQLADTVAAAGPRYTPELHIDLPVALALEGLAGSNAFLHRYRRYRGDAVRAARDLARWAGSSEELEAAYAVMSGAQHGWLGVCRENPPADEASCERLIQATQKCDDAAEDLRRLARALYDAAKKPPNATPEEQRAREVLSSILQSAYRWSRELNRLDQFLDSFAMRAFVCRSLFMTGVAGQGKTHLFCDVASSAIDRGVPAIALLGERFGAGDPWQQIAAQLGLPPVSREEFIGAMEAAGEARGARFLLMIDALNESGDPSLWRNELRPMLSRLKRSPWIAIAISCRSSYVDVVTPVGGLDDLTACVNHPGFAAREGQAIAKFFAHFGLEQPRVPFLFPEFTNPLFLKLYCVGLKDLGMTTPPPGHQHLTAVFDRFVESRASAINKELSIDPNDHAVERAIRLIAERLADNDGDYVAYDEAKKLVEALAPARTEWPRTLFGVMLSEGLIRRDRVYLDEQRTEAVGFAYQRFSDHIVVGAVIDNYVSPEPDLGQALAPAGALARFVDNANQGYLEALAVQIPERFGIELQDAFPVDEEPGGWTREQRFRALLDSIVIRDRATITDRTRELINAGLDEHRMFEETVDVLIAVAADPEHPFNAEMLHRTLMRWPMSDRDTWWTTATYWSLGTHSQLDRLIRWAAAGPHPQYEDDVLELASLPLVWLFASPNRPLRDYTTKSVVQLLHTRLPILGRLLARFENVDDPYVLERLAIAIHGAVLRGGADAPSEAAELSTALRDVVLRASSTAPQLLTRDAARGAIEWCVARGLLPQDELGEARPPYTSKPPANPPLRSRIDQRYSTYRSEEAAPGYEHLLWSIFEDDFAIYVITPKVSHITKYRRDKPMPAKAEGARRHENQYPADRAKRWVFQRCVRLGWTPERFGRFDDQLDRRSRDEHKPERFGKKYQWIALRELVARLTDNYRWAEDSWGDPAGDYKGPWQIYGRDIDPTLPPPPIQDEHDEFAEPALTFEEDDRRAWWVPTGPEYQEAVDDVRLWVHDDADVPTTEELVVKVDDSSDRWIATRSYFTWKEVAPEDEEPFGVPRREQWSHLYPWLVRNSDAAEFEAFLKQRSLMGRWMPEGGDITSTAYLGEVPWAASCREYPPEWTCDYDNLPVEVLPFATGYIWEGNILDCSLSEAVHAAVPVLEVFNAGTLTWAGGTAWRSSDQVVAEYRNARDKFIRHSSMLVREIWLRDVLDKLDCTLVIGRLGEKRMIGGGFEGKPQPWLELNALAIYEDGVWRFSPVRAEKREPVERR
ncbi:MAG TPA: hypothetical protein VGH52_08205 [Gaiellaceae bacterium]|jgi:hypothetical protein